MPMNSWEIYEARLHIAGEQARDRAIRREQDAIMRKYLTLPALKTVTIGDHVQRLIINSTDIASEKTFNTLPGEIINLGDVLFWNDMHWLVTQVDFDDEVTRSGRIVQCNRQLKWQNRKTGKIVERWCLATKPYTSNIAEGIAIANSNREYKIQLSYDEETIQVDLDRRFLLEVIDGIPKAYEVTSVDTLTNRYQDIDGGFLIWNLKQCEYNPATDNAELMIADYFDTDIPVVEAGLLPCSISGRETIRKGMSRTYTATFYDAAGTDVSDTVECLWSVDPGKMSAVPSGNTVRVTLDGDAEEGEHVQIVAADKNGLYEPATFFVEVIDLL